MMLLALLFVIFVTQLFHHSFKSFKYAFSYCTDLKAVIFPYGSCLKTIEEGAFTSSGVVSLELPPSVTEIKSFAFESCFSLKKFVFPKNNKFKIIEASLLRGASIEEIKIPSSVKQINFRAFSDCHDLKDIYFPPDSQLSKMENYVFYYNKSLESISIPLSLKENGAFIFCGCSNLKFVNIPMNTPMKFISSLMFFATGLRSIVIPPNMQSIYNECFAECEELRCVEFLGENIVMSYECFDNCSNLAAVSFPNAKKIEIDKSSFREFSNVLIFTHPECKVKFE